MSVNMDQCIPDVDFTCIEEIHGSNVCFVICSIITKVLKNKLGCICLILFHNSFNHYQNIILKLGYNLELLRNRGIVRVIEVSDYTVNYITNTSNVSCKVLLSDIIKKLNNLNYQKQCTYLIMEDVSHMLLTKSIKESVSFIQCFHSIVNYTPTLKLVISSHVSLCDKQQTIFLSLIKYMADVIIKVTPLSTGFSSEMSGHLEIRIRNVNNQVVYYNYKLEEDKVHVYSYIK